MRLIRYLFPVVLLAACTGNRQEAAAGADGAAFLHIADPRLAQAGAAGPANQAAFASALDRLRARPGQQSPPALLIITGDLTGAAPTAPAPASTTPPTGTRTDTTRADSAAQPADSATTDSATQPAGDTATTASAPVPDAAARAAAARGALDAVARNLVAAPVKDIYLAPAPADSVLADSLRARMGAAVAVHDLTACYPAGDLAACMAELPDTTYRLVGFTPGAPLGASVQRLDTLVSDGRARGKKMVVIASAVPAALTKPLAADTAAARVWRSILEHSEVLGVVTGGAPVAGENYKVKRVGALSPAGALASRAVAEGRSTTSGLEYKALPYRVAFGDPRPAAARDGTGIGAIGRPVAWLWGLAPGAPDLPKFVIVAIALLVAALTVAALWRLEDDGRSPAAAPAPPAADGTSTTTTVTTTTGTATQPTKPAHPTSAFDNNFSRTILSGLAGLLVLSFIQISWKDLFADANPFYIAWFIALFITLLWLYAIARGLIEALRSRIANPYVAPRFSPTPGTAGVRKRTAYPRYWVRRSFRWAVSYRATVLVFLDTVLGIVLGRNQLRSGVWERTIVDLHWSLNRVMEGVRRDLSDALNDALETPPPTEDANARAARRASADVKRVRVSISLLAQDGLSVYYVVPDEGALSVHFPANSVAWVAAASGQARWWKKSYLSEKISVFDNRRGALPGFPQTPLALGEFFERRVGADYEAFLVLPFPRRRSKGQEGLRSGAIHISFAFEEDFDRIFGTTWDAPDPDAEQPAAPDPANVVPPPANPSARRVPRYENAHEAFDLPDPGLARMLRLTADVLGNAIERFDDDVFETYIRPCRGR